MFNILEIRAVFDILLLLMFENNIKIEYFNIENFASLSKEYDFFSPANSAAAKNSFKSAFETGVYQLPVINGNTFIWGFETVRQARLEGLKSLYCRFINSQLSEKQMLQIALLCENRSGSYLWREKEKIYNFTVKYLENNLPEEILLCVQPEGDFRKNAAAFADLQEHFKQFVDSDFIDLKTAVYCSRINSEIAEKLFPVLEAFTYSKRRIFLTDLQDIIVKNSLNTDETCKFAQTIALTPEPAVYIQSLKFPQLSKNIEDFNRFVENNLKNSGIRLKYPPYFEGKSYNVEFSFSGKKHLEKVIKHLENMKERSDELFKLL